MNDDAHDFTLTVTLGLMPLPPKTLKLLNPTQPNVEVVSNLIGLSEASENFRYWRSGFSDDDDLSAGRLVQ